MPLDAQKLQDFYGSPLGDLARRLIGRIVRARWQGTAGLTVAALGYGSPYLDRFRDAAERCLALMPAEQGAAIWPESDRCAVALVHAAMLPLPDNSVDRMLLAHAIEAAERPGELLEEVWRVVAPEGRLLVIAPSRRGVWARADGTPFGHGLPYSKAQLRDLLHGAVFSPVYWGEALFAPPIDRQFVIRSAPTIERMGAVLGLPFAGVHVVEAVKQVHRPVGVRALPRPRRVVVVPALAPSARREGLRASCAELAIGDRSAYGLEGVCSSSWGKTDVE
ncbi:MAG TPA: methyltransferase domain-containing protein [Roseiarcus sp.]|nr:methyltransferase domain-containing protein [Roseiarcus sp.]